MGGQICASHVLLLARSNPVAAPFLAVVHSRSGHAYARHAGTRAHPKPLRIVAPVIEKHPSHILHALTHWCVKRVCSTVPSAQSLGRANVQSCVALQPSVWLPLVANRVSMLLIHVSENPRCPLKRPWSGTTRLDVTSSHCAAELVRVEGYQSESLYYLWKLFRLIGGDTWSRGGKPPVRHLVFPADLGFPRVP